jgi:hypothetical protein
VPLDRRYLQEGGHQCTQTFLHECSIERDPLLGWVSKALWLENLWFITSQIEGRRKNNEGT